MEMAKMSCRINPNPTTFHEIAFLFELKSQEIAIKKTRPNRPCNMEVKEMATSIFLFDWPPN